MEGSKWDSSFSKDFCQVMALQQRFDDGCLQITWYNASGKRCVDDVRDGRQEDVKVFIKKRRGPPPVHPAVMQAYMGREF